MNKFFICFQFSGDTTIFDNIEVDYKGDTSTTQRQGSFYNERGKKKLAPQFLSARADRSPRFYNFILRRFFATQRQKKFREKFSFQKLEAGTYHEV